MASCEMFDEADSQTIRALAQRHTPSAVEFAPGVTPVPVSGKIIGQRERELVVEAALEG